MSENSKIQKLRQEAEQIINDNNMSQSSQPIQNEWKELIHELHVHQVELELQNQELQESNRDLQKSRQAYKNLFDFAPVAYFVKTKSGDITDANQSALTLLDPSYNKLIGQSFTKFVHHDDQDTYYLHLREIFSSTDESSCEIRLYSGDGEYLDVKMTSQRLDESNVFRCAVVDITPIQRAKRELADLLAQQKQMNHLYKRVVSSLLHEIRTPLAIIQSSTEMIDRYGSRLDEEAIEKRFSHIYNNVQYLESVVQELVVAHDDDEALDNSPPDDEILLADMVEKIIENWRNEGQSIHLEDTLPDGMKTSQWSDRTLTRILYNLVSNAIKYSDDDIRIHLSSHQDNIVIKVIDSGRGIPEEDMTHIFEMMYRGNNIHGIRGTGIGLYTVQKTLKNLGGTVAIDSEINHGTTVTVHLPYQR